MNNFELIKFFSKNSIRNRITSLNSENKNGNSLEEKTPLYEAVEEANSNEQMVAG